MKFITEHILDIALTSIIVVFLIIYIMAGNINGHKGIFESLKNNEYNTISDSIESPITDEAKSVMTNAQTREDYVLTYINGVNKVSFVNDLGEQENVYSLKDMFIISFDGNDYKYDGSSNAWLVKNGISFVAQTGDSIKDFNLTLLDVTSNNKSVLVTKTGDDMSSNENGVIFYNDDTDNIVSTQSGAYEFSISLKERNCGELGTKQITIPFQ